MSAKCYLFVCCMYVFNMDSIAPDNQLGCSSLEKTTFPNPSFFSVAYNFCCGVGAL